MADNATKLAMQVSNTSKANIFFPVLLTAFSERRVREKSTIAITANSTKLKMISNSLLLKILEGFRKSETRNPNNVIKTMGAKIRAMMGEIRFTNEGLLRII
jgi:hypothetical protein